MKSRSHNLHRVLLYSHDTYGLGHLRRNLAIARHLIEVVPELQVVVLTGSPAAGRFPLPRGVSLVSLPPVVKVAAEEYRSRDPRVEFAVVRRARAAIIADVARRFEPDVFLVDHAPHGMKGELLLAFDTLRSHSPRTRIVLGLRDVIDDAATIRSAWEQQGVFDTLERVFDHVVIYGRRDMLDLATAYGFPRSVRERTTYCGYLWRTGTSAAPEQIPDGIPDRFVLATGGGGGDGLDVLIATLHAAEALGMPSLLVSGPLMDAGERCRLEAAVSASPGGRIVEFVPGLERLMKSAAAIVTMGGYNSLCEVVPTGVPAIVVPRVWPRREQAIRAALFAERGLVHVVDPGPALEARLLPVLRDALASPRQTGAAIPLDDGFDRLCDVLMTEADLGAAAARPMIWPSIAASPSVLEERVPA